MNQEVYDINKLPPEEGLLVFLISMSRIHNKGQGPQTCWDDIHHFHPNKVQTNKPNAKVGALFVYGDYLYFHSDEKASVLKKRFMDDINKHKNSIMKLVYKDTFIIKDAFSFKVWNQLYIDNPQFVDYFYQLKNIYEQDNMFQKYLKEDFEEITKEDKIFNDNQINFFLEEHLAFYLIAKGKIQLDNKFILGHEKWILNCYHGKPMKAHIYLHQLNPFKLKNSQNVYENSWYDLSEKKLYDFDKIDLD